MKTDFTPFQRLLLQLIASDLTALDIAEKLKKSVRTIEGHRDLLKKKCGVKTLAGLVAYAINNEIIKLEEIKLCQPNRED